MTGRNLRLLGLDESPNRQSSIQEIIDELRMELAKGEAVYTADELRILEQKLAAYERFLENMLAT